MSKNTCFCAHLAHRMSKWTKSLKIDFDMHWTENKAVFSWKTNTMGDFWPFSGSFWSQEFIFGPRNLFRDLWFRSRPSVRPYVRPYGIYFLTARRIFLNFFLMDSSWEGAKTYRARFLNFWFFAPVKVQKHLFFVLFFKYLKNRELKFFNFLIFYSSRRAGHFLFLVRDRSVESSPWKWAKTPVFVHI